VIVATCTTCHEQWEPVKGSLVHVVTSTGAFCGGRGEWGAVRSSPPRPRRQRKVPEGTYLGSAEVAAHLGVTRELVAQWHKRGRLPTPIASLACGPVWALADITDWSTRRKENAR
jgi:predicted DNA-binding transcriptional regulator AlpA